MSQGNRLKSVIEGTGLNQSEFAETLGITQSAISQYLNDKRTFDKPLAIAIQAKYNVSANWLLTGEGSQETDFDDQLDSINELRKYGIAARKDGIIRDLFESILKMSNSEREKVRIFFKDFLGK